MNIKHHTYNVLMNIYEKMLLLCAFLVKILLEKRFSKAQKKFCTIRKFIYYRIVFDVYLLFDKI